MGVAPSVFYSFVDYSWLEMQVVYWQCTASHPSYVRLCSGLEEFDKQTPSFPGPFNTLELSDFDLTKRLKQAYPELTRHLVLPPYRCPDRPPRG